MDNSNSELSWGILATGNIAHDFCSDILLTSGNRIAAVCSREMNKAQAFADKFGIKHAYDNYQKMLENSDVQVVYVATPHPFHYQATLDALRAGKHVVCEKPLGMNLAQVQACVAEAQKQNKFLLEAVWMYFFPAVQQAKTWLEQGKIGKPKLLEASFDFCAPQDPENRLFNMALGGGALLDIGLYPLFMATLMLGEGAMNGGFCLKHETGADVFNQFHCQHSGGVASTLKASFQYDKTNEAYIYGDLGYIKIHHHFFSSRTVSLHLYQGESQTLEFDHEGLGYGYEIAAVREAILAGAIECETYPHKKMLSNHGLLSAVMQHFDIDYSEHL